MDATALTQTAVSGLANGALYAFVGLSFSLVSRSTGLINFAQGDLTMLGGMLTAVMAGGGVPLLVAVPIGFTGVGRVRGGSFDGIARTAAAAATPAVLHFISILNLSSS